MFIKRITLKNFKSFKKAEIVFNSNFTAITGPNGSGKSNIIDSILFCLGITTSKTLRADRLTDLIRIGCNEAEVAIEIGDLRIRRRIKKTERGYYSYYYLNDRSVPYSEIERVVENLGIHDHSIIMQGDVTRIAEMSPVQRRKIIDEISGISEFDEKKEKAIAELEEVKNDIEKLDIIISEVNTRLERLKRDRDEALRFKSLIEERKKMNEYLRAHEYLGIKSRVERIKNELETLESRKDKLTGELIEINSSLIELNRKAEEISEKIASFGDAELRRIQEEIIRRNSEIRSIVKLREIFERELKKIEEEKTRAMVDVSKLREDLKKIEEEIEDLNVRRRSINGIIRESESRLEYLRNRLERMSLDLKRLNEELIRKKDELEELKDKRNRAVRDRDKLLENLRRIEMEVNELRSEREKIDISSIEGKIERYENELRMLEKRLEDLKEDMRGIEGRIFDIRDGISRVDEEIKEKEIELAKLEYERPRSVDVILKARDRGILKKVYGTVAQLGDVDERYALALEIAGGNSLNFIVVEDDDEAVRAIRYLKDVDGGRASFIPINRIKVDLDLDKSVLKREGVIDYAINLIRCDKRFRKVFELIYRDTIVVRDIDVAREIMDNKRIVTLDGDLIEKSGIITGGSIQKKKTPFGFKKEEKLRKDLEDLRKRRSELLNSLEMCEESRRKIQSEIDELNSRISKIRSDVMVEKSRLEEIKKILNSIDLKISEKVREEKEINSRILVIEEEIKNLNCKISRVEGEICEIEEKLGDRELLKLTNEIERIREEIMRKREILANIDRAIDGNMIRVEQIKRLIKEKEEKIEKMEKKEKEIRENITKHEERLRELNRELEDLRKYEEEICERVKDLRYKRDSVLNEIRSLIDKKSKIELEIGIIDERIRNKRLELEKLKDQLKSFEDIEIEDLPPLNLVKNRLKEIEEELSEFRDVNMKSIQEYEEVKSRRDDLMSRRKKLEEERREIIRRIKRYEELKRKTFLRVFDEINRNFREIVGELAEGEGELYLDGDDPLSSGLHIVFRPFKKKIQKLESMSGGEKSLATLAFIFAIQRFKPAPFYVFDEVDMFLDGVNVERVARMIKKQSEKAQFIVVSLRKPMLEQADAIIGVTRGGEEESIVTAIRLK